MNTTTVKTYVEQLLEMVAAELNVKSVIIERDGVNSEYKYDTIKRKTVGMDYWEMASLVFSGNILTDMKIVRDIVKSGLKERADANIPVRQPLQSITLEV